MGPPDFHIDHGEDWSRWVLDRGLPELPGSELGIEESVPVAFWIGSSPAAVLHIRRVREDTGEAALSVEGHVDVFVWAGSGWEDAGSGGAGGNDDPCALTRADVPGDHVDLSGVAGAAAGDRGCKALWDTVGTGALVARSTTARSPCGCSTPAARSWPRSMSRPASRSDGGGENPG